MFNKLFELHRDDLSHHIDFEEIESVDIRSILMDCYSNVIYNFKNKLLE